MLQRGLELDSVRAQLEGSAPGAQALREEGLQAWACTAGEESVEALCAAVAAAEQAKGAVVAAHQGFLRKLARQFSNQVCSTCLLQLTCCQVAEVLRNALLPLSAGGYGWCGYLQGAAGCSNSCDCWQQTFSASAALGLHAQHKTTHSHLLAVHLTFCCRVGSQGRFVARCRV